MPNSNLSVETTLVLLTICISIGPYAQIAKGVLVHYGESLQLRFWCKTGTLLLKSLIGWKKSLTQRYFPPSDSPPVHCMFLHKICLSMVILLQNFASPMNQVQNRIWLMHWSLFIFFNHDNGRTQIIDLFNQDKYVLFFCQFFIQYI